MGTLVFAALQTLLDTFAVYLNEVTEAPFAPTHFPVTSSVAADTLQLSSE